jgi:exodeoxyribonuclease V alpha subunit
VRIFKTYGADAIQVMTDNPYRLARDIRGTAGHPFEITLSSGGAAKATRGEGMTGLVGRRANNAVSHGRCPVQWILA